MKRITLYFLFLFFGPALYSCATSIPKADKAHEDWAERHWHNIRLSQAREVYTANCSGCHNLHSPAEHTQEEWVKLFDEMASKAHMSAQDSVAVLAYLETFSKDNRLLN